MNHNDGGSNKENTDTDGGGLEDNVVLFTPFFILAIYTFHSAVTLDSTCGDVQTRIAIIQATNTGCRHVPIFQDIRTLAFCQVPRA